MSTSSLKMDILDINVNIPCGHGIDLAGCDLEARASLTLFRRTPQEET
jgi:hypothetical protein